MIVWTVVVAAVFVAPLTQISSVYVFRSLWYIESFWCIFRRYYDYYQLAHGCNIGSIYILLDRCRSAEGLRGRTRLRIGNQGLTSGCCSEARIVNQLSLINCESTVSAIYHILWVLYDSHTRNGRLSIFIRAFPLFRTLEQRLLVRNWWSRLKGESRYVPWNTAFIAVYDDHENADYNDKCCTNDLILRK